MFNERLITNNYYRQRGRYTKGTKTWRQRRLREEARWAELIEPLTDAFVEWRFGPSADVPPRPDEPVARPEVPTREDEPVVPPIDEDVPMEYVWTVEHAFDLFTLVEDIKINRREDSLSPAIDLARHGWIAKTPENPGTAVSIKTLELLYRLRQRKPSFSAEAFTKVMCDYYRVRAHLVA